MKRYILFRFPALNGEPKEFRFKISAYLATLFSNKVFELYAKKVDKYYAYWR